jgi:hypothetical protein
MHSTAAERCRIYVHLMYRLCNVLTIEAISIMRGCAENMVSQCLCLLEFIRQQQHLFDVCLVRHPHRLLRTAYWHDLTPFVSTDALPVNYAAGRQPFLGTLPSSCRHSHINVLVGRTA